MKHKIQRGQKKPYHGMILPEHDKVIHVFRNDVKKGGDDQKHAQKQEQLVISALVKSSYTQCHDQRGKRQHRTCIIKKVNVTRHIINRSKISLMTINNDHLLIINRNHYKLLVVYNPAGNPVFNGHR